MRVLVLHAHPVAESYNGHLHRLIVDRLTAGGHEVDDCDLYAEDFDPRMSRKERLSYHEIGANTGTVREHVERLQSAEALVMCYPVWNFGYPAILKGYFDRVFLPGVSFELAGGRVRPSLHNICKVAAVSTYGAQRLSALAAGDPPRKLVRRVLRLLVKPGAEVGYHAHYDMNRSTDATRSRFAARVRAAMDGF